LKSDFNPLKLSHPNVLSPSHVDNLTKVIVKFLLLYVGLSKSDLALKFVCFVMDGVMIFQGSKIGVTMQLKEKHVPFYCATH
jgi:hypothetical protein